MASSKRIIEGPLSKWTNLVNGWQYRWFVLDQNAGLLSYYTVSCLTQEHACIDMMTDVFSQRIR